MLSTALFSSHHGRFQPGKTKSNKSSSSTSSSNKKSIGDYDAQVPTLCRFVKFDSTDNFIPFQSQSSPLVEHRQHQNQFSTDDNRQDDKKDERDAISDQQVTIDSTDDSRITNVILDSLVPQSDTTNRRRTNSFFRQNRPTASAALRRSSTSSSSTSTSQRSSNGSSKLSMKLKSSLVNNNSHYQSCPDLLKPCLNRNSTSYDSGLSSTLSRHKFSKSEKNLLKHKPIPQWSLDDVLTWLQSVGLEAVTSVLIGYEITGNDVLAWNDESLESLGIADQSKREQIIDELHKLKLFQSSNKSSPKKISSQRQFSLFSMIRLSQYDRIKVLELPPSTTVRDFTVATDPMEMALVVTSCKSSLIDLKKGDLIIELNGITCIKLAPVDFNKLLHELNGHKYQMVILRKSPSDAHDDHEPQSNPSPSPGPKTISATKSLNVFHL